MAELKAVTDALEVKFAADLKVVQDHADLLDVKLQEKGATTQNVDTLVKSIKDNFEGISNVRKGNAVQVKAVGNMTLPVNLTGDAPRDYNLNVVLVPGQALNVSDLVGSVNIEGGTYTYPRETGGEGSISTQII